MYKIVRLTLVLLAILGATASAFQWIRSVSIQDDWQFKSEAGRGDGADYEQIRREIVISTFRGSLEVRLLQFDIDPSRVVTNKWTISREYDHSRKRATRSVAAFGRFKYKNARYNDGSNHMHGTVLEIPLYLPIVASIMIGLLAHRRRILRWVPHPLAGTCSGCGYDLRASAGRCPECGRLIGNNSDSP
jgi:hypothetical protein